MAEATEFPEADRIEDFEPPAPSRPLPVKTFAESSVSCWQLDADEKANAATTGAIWLTTQTFRSLDERPDGERYQPAVSITARRDDALRGWPDAAIDAAPAADRIVRYTDNQAVSTRRGMRSPTSQSSWQKAMTTAT